MSESFESAMVTVHKYRLLSDKMCNRLQRAHEHEMELTRHTYDLALAQARDPQRLRGAKPDTFDGAIEALWEFRWQHATNNKDVIPYISAVKDAHDHEIEQMRTEIVRLRSTPVYNESCSESYEILRERIKTNCENDPNVWVETLTLGALEAYGEAVEQRIQHIRKAEYHRGYEDGQRSMDAEHRAVCHKLRRVMLDGDSHTMLSRLAYAIYPCATGWTGESCEGLREHIIELLGGVHDEPSSDIVRGFACAAGCDHRDGQSQSEEVNGPRGEPGQPGAPDITDELRSFVSDRMTKRTVYTTLPDSESETQLTEEGYKLIAIADRIDERFDKAMTSLCNEVGCHKMRAIQLEGERDKLRKSLRKIAEHTGVQHDLELSTYDDDTVAKATVQLVCMMHKHIYTLEEKLDAIREILDE